MKKILNYIKVFLKYLFKSIHIIYLLVLIILFVASLYMKYKFSNETIDEIYFYLVNGAEKSDVNVFISAIKECLWFGLLLIFLIIGLFHNILIKYRFIVKFIRNKKEDLKIQLYPIKLVYNHKIIFTFLLTFILGYMSCDNMKVFAYFENNIVSSDFIEANYVYPEKAKVTFNKKNNLIMIFVESLETTFFTKKQGGDWDYEVIPELYDLLFEEDSIYFSSDDKVGGMLNLETTTWTTGSVVSNTTGLPFKIPIDGNEYHSENFMNGSYALGDMLKKHGYYNELISSAHTSFGGFNEYFTKHGNYNIIDIDNLSDVKFKLKNSDKGPWGFNDRYLFNVAKERLNVLSKNKEPFNLTLVGVDTHFIDGFKGDYTIDKYDTQYENVYATESKLVYDFVSWVKKQDFYEDTTIVIIGDHISMQDSFFEEHNQDLRKRYFLIINPLEDTNNYKNRLYTSLDTYPTVISAIGGEIEGNKLGLGVNLFSMKKTLAERDDFNFDYINEEIVKKSDFYNEQILGSDYEEMIEELGLEETKEEE